MLNKIWRILKNNIADIDFLIWNFSNKVALLEPLMESLLIERGERRFEFQKLSLELFEILKLKGIADRAS